jgi:AraC family transcriptional activator of pobA
MLDHIATQQSAIPMFFLYGEQQREIGARFLHVEPLELRSRPSGWEIRPHAHADLNHVLFIHRGDGRMTADGATIGFAAPCLLILPARRVHGFRFAPETVGWVMTIGESYVRELTRREADFWGLFDQVQCLAVDETAALELPIKRLSQELAWKAPASAAAIEGNLLGILVAALRLSRHAARQALPLAGRSQDIVARFRALIEARFRRPGTLADFAAALHVTEGQLRRACLQVAGRPPVALLHDRVFLEAQRLLIYTNMTIAEAGNDLNFSEPGYFTRFFTKRAGQSPRDFRRARLRND